MDLSDRYRGALLGLAVGDALGTTLEFKQPGTFTPITDMVGGGPFGLKPGQWTDDTSMALCLTGSLVECRAFDPVDQLTRYCRWHREGYLSSMGRCFDIGNTVRSALERFERTREPYCGPTDPHTAGNGSLMRLAPVPLFFARNPKEAIERAGDSSRTTHGAREAVVACRYFAGLIVGAAQDRTKDELLSPGFCGIPGTPYVFRRDAPPASIDGSDQRGTHSLLPPVRPVMGDAFTSVTLGSGPEGLSGNLRTLSRRERGTMNAIRAIHPYRHEGLWVFDEGQRSAISGQLSAKTSRGTPSRRTVAWCAPSRPCLIPRVADR